MAYHPKEIGELHYVVMSNGQKVLARVTAITGDNEWTAVNADLDDAAKATGLEPQVAWKVKS